MRVNNFWLFAIPALIWGTTWYVIKFQLGSVDPLVSVVYRFLLAGTIMIAYCLVKKVNLRFSFQDHLFMVMQGFFLFGINYWLVYEAEQHIASGLMAVAFSMIIFMNAGFGALFLGKPLNKKVLIAALAGLTGTGLIFSSGLFSVNFSDQMLIGAILAILSVVLASLGNISSARNSASGIPVIQANAFGMLYGGLLMGIVAILLDRPFTFEFTNAYFYSLIYLTLFGSITAFAGYLTLISRIGADKAAYTLVVIPVISIGISMVFENYQLTPLSVIGILLILVGNVLALRK